MIQTAEQIIENVRALPKPEREKFFELIEAEKPEKGGSRDLEKQNEKFRLALKWVEENRKEFDGQFVLLEGDRLIAHGKNPKKLYEAARAEGIDIPFVKRIIAEDKPFGGW
jgi:Family of unknown function (DUF5678)